jgi:hypothetical protein
MFPKTLLFCFGLFSVISLVPEEWRFPVGTALMVLAMPFLLRVSRSTHRLTVTPVRLLATLILLGAGFAALHLTLVGEWREWSMIVWAISLSRVYCVPVDPGPRTMATSTSRRSASPSDR